MKLKHLDLFSGIGGFSLGLEATGGFETVAFCDIDQYPRQVLQKHWPHVKQYEDIKELNYERLKADGIDSIDIITGGYPCQPFSVAGRKKGEEDPRHLWPPLSRTWRVKTTPLGRLVFQLRASVPTTKEKESGLWRTPDAHSGRGPSSEKRMKMKLDKKMPISLNDQVAHSNLMWPTPAAHEGRLGYQRRDTGKKGTQKSLTTIVIDTEGGREKTTGQLNPTWVEWLMGYPSGWTDLNH